MKRGTRPKARSTKPVGPLAAGKATVNRAMTKASASAPAIVIAHPATPFQPKGARLAGRSEEHTSELQSLMRISYAVFCLNKKRKKIRKRETRTNHNVESDTLTTI